LKSTEIYNSTSVCHFIAAKEKGMVFCHFWLKWLPCVGMHGYPSPTLHNVLGVNEEPYISHMTTFIASSEFTSSQLLAIIDH
jgi:hypothetical protein